MVNNESISFGIFFKQKPTQHHMCLIKRSIYFSTDVKKPQLSGLVGDLGGGYFKNLASGNVKGG
jgi:hypothetical protein